jgi:flagellar P-ring protein precursor FlgI
MGVQIDRNALKVKNVASVMITAKLPPFVKTGQTIDVTLSSLGDATSLKGGTLIATPLKGLDGQVYAISQGAVSLGGSAARVAGRENASHTTVARIPNGATVEREVPLLIAEKEKITLSLDTPDFTTVTRMLTAVNGFLGSSTSAKAVDGSTIDIVVPDHYRNNVIGLLAEVENLEVTPDAIARVVLNERTGTVVMGENIRIRELALSHGNLHIHIAAQTVQEPQTSKGGPTEAREISLQGGATLGEIVQALNAVGVAPQEMIAIFQSIKASGSLQAELEII